jgi:hypothetical protein
MNCLIIVDFLNWVINMKNSEFLFSNLPNSFLTLDEALVVVNQFADTQEYTVIKKRTKINNVGR